MKRPLNEEIHELGFSDNHGWDHEPVLTNDADVVQYKHAH